MIHSFEVPARHQLSNILAPDQHNDCVLIRKLSPPLSLLPILESFDQNQITKQVLLDPSIRLLPHGWIYLQWLDLFVCQLQIGRSF